MERQRTIIADAFKSWDATPKSRSVLMSRAIRIGSPACLTLNYTGEKLYGKNCGIFLISFPNRAFGGL